MAAQRRWIRIDVGWSRSEWLAELSPGARLAWIELLMYAKSDGTCGEVRAISPSVFGRIYGIPTEDVAAMLAAAERDGALQIDGKTWKITNWGHYQEPDRTASERKRRQRAKGDGKGPDRRHGLSRVSRRDNRDVTVRHGVTTVTDGVTRRATETETSTETETGGKPASSGPAEMLAEQPSSLPEGEELRRDKRAAPRVWSREACDDWNERFGRGSAPGGRIGRALQPLVKQHGWEKVRPAWQRYLREEDAKYVSAQAFAAKFAVWAEPPKRRSLFRPDGTWDDDEWIRQIESGEIRMRVSGYPDDPDPGRPGDEESTSG